MPSRMTATKARTARAVDRAVVERRSTAAWSSPLTLAAWRRIQNSIQVTTPAARSSVAASNSCSYGSWKLPTVTIQREPEDGAQDDRQPGAEEDLGEVSRVAGLGQIGADDGDDERRLDALAKAGQQAAGERADIHPVAGSRRSARPHDLAYSRSLVTRTLASLARIGQAWPRRRAVSRPRGSRTGRAASWRAGTTRRARRRAPARSRPAPAGRPGRSTPSAAASPRVACRIDRNLVPSSSPDRTPSQIST